MFKACLVCLLGLAAFVASPLTSPRNQAPTRTQCTTEYQTRMIAEETSLPEYPSETEPGSSKGLVFATVLFGTDGKLSKIKFYETPNEQASEAVKTALEKWRLQKLFGGGQEPIMTKTGIRFHFVFEGDKGRVEVATEQEQGEFGREWGKKVCRASFDE